MNLDNLKNSVSSAHKTQCVFIKNISWLMLFREMIAVHPKHINTLRGQIGEMLNAKSGDTSTPVVTTLLYRVNPQFLLALVAIPPPPS
jgi:hypothetical protein